MKYKLPLTNSKKVEASDHNEIRAEDIKTYVVTTKEMFRQIFNEVLKQDDCTPETWRRIRIKVIFKEKEMWRRLVTTGRSVLCKRCTNCSQQSYKTDFTADSTKRNLKTREGLDVLTKRWTILQHTDCWNRTCRERGIKLWVAIVDFMKAFDSISHQSLRGNRLTKCGLESHHYKCLVRRLYAEEKGSVSTDKESDMFEIKRRAKQGDRLSSLLFNTVLQMALKDDVERWRKSKRHGYTTGGPRI